MGNSCSSGGGVAAPPMRELSALEVLTANKVKEYITKHRVETSKTLDQIVLKFPAVRLAGRCCLCVYAREFISLLVSTTSRTCGGCAIRTRLYPVPSSPDSYPRSTPLDSVA